MFQLRDWLFTCFFLRDQMHSHSLVYTRITKILDHVMLWVLLILSLEDMWNFLSSKSSLLCCREYCWDYLIRLVYSLVSLELLRLDTFFNTVHHASFDYIFLHLTSSFDASSIFWYVPTGSWNDVFKVAVVLYIVGTLVWNIFSTGEKVLD